MRSSIDQSAPDSNSSPAPVYPGEELEWLHKDFRPLNALEAGISDRIMHFIVTGEGGEVLEKLEKLRGPDRGIAPEWSGGAQRTPDRVRFFQETTIADPALHMRLGLVCHAVTCSTEETRGGRPGISPGLAGGAEFLDAYLWEAQHLAYSNHSRIHQPTTLSAAKMECMLELHGNPAAWLVRGALLVDMRVGHDSRRLIASAPDFHDSLIRHVSMVRECLLRSDNPGRSECIWMLRNAKFPPALCADAAALLAVNTAKGVREAAEAWITLDPKAVLPEMRQIAREAKTAERVLAVKWLHRYGGEEGYAFLADYLNTEKSVKVLEAVQICLRASGKGDAGTQLEAAAFAPLPPLPDLFAEEALAPSLLHDLRDLVARANKESMQEWEKAQGRPWATKKPTQLPAGMAEEWFTLLQTMDSAIHPQQPLQNGDYLRPCLMEFGGHRDFRLVHVTRWAAILNRDLFTREHARFGAGTQCFEAWMRSHGSIDYRQLEAICRKLRFQADWIWQLWLDWSTYADSDFCRQSDGHVWPYFSTRLHLLEQALGWMPSDDSSGRSHIGPTSAESAWRALATFPAPPPTFLDRMWEVALGSAKQERALAQTALQRAPDLKDRLATALTSSQKDRRSIAAEWIGRLGLTALIPALHAAVSKEKHDALKAAMITTLERLGVAPDQFLDRAALLRDSRRITAGPAPEPMAWFPLGELPAVHWSDSGAAVEPEILHAWLMQACKVKQVEPDALMRRYALSFRPQEREALGMFVLEAWLAEDVAPPSREKAEQAAAKQVMLWHRCQPGSPQFADICERFLPGLLASPLESAIDSKGLLSVAAACAGAEAAPAVARYLTKWYGLRVHQCRALLQMLAWIAHPSAIQTLLAVGTRFRTKGLQEEAARLVQAIAERKGWSLAELADRSIPSADLDEEGILTLDFGPRQFTARLDAAMNLVMKDPEGKIIKTLPDPRKDDDSQKAAAAKKQLAAARKALKQVVEQQQINLYEAMCVQRTWSFADWELFLCRHPIVRHFCQRLVWSGQRGEETFQFRPLADGSFTDVEDNPLTLGPEDVISVAHQTTMPSGAADAWLQHLNDYEIRPLLDQFGRSGPELNPQMKLLRELKDFEGWMSITLKIRARATNLGYTRGPSTDGGWFSDYTKNFPTAGLVAVIGFTGSRLPEMEMTAALTNLTFRRIGHSQSTANLPLSEIPSVLLAECWNDYRQLAIDGSGFDPAWEKKSGL